MPLPVSAPEHHHPALRRQLAWDALMVALTVVDVGLVLVAEVTGRWRATLEAVDLALVALFALDLGRRARRAEDLRAFAWAHGWEVLSLVPLALGPLALMRTLRLVRIAELVRLGILLVPSHRLRRPHLFLHHVVARGRLVHLTVVASAMVLLVSQGVWLLERGGNPALGRYGDALWWAIVTATTVGYGDIIPVTWQGRALAVMLMLTGVGLIGVVASSLSAALVALDVEHAAGGDLVGELERLARLHAQGELSDEEFTAAKRRLLRIAP